jgi:heme/copper-type cytochrome/quinol oxidase subunit 2
MRILLNPFWVFVAVAFVALAAIVLISYRRSEKRALTSGNEPGVTIRTDALPTIVVVLALAVILVPFGIAAAALAGPEVGIVAYGALLAGACIAGALWRRSRG